MAAPLIIEDRHFAYLRLQKGSIRDLERDRTAWRSAFERNLADDYAGMVPYLPKSCNSILDIGGGLGAIDVLLARKYGVTCEVCVLDGESDPPLMNLHRKTFNDMRVTADFLRKNGVARFSCYTPSRLENPRPFDLIISLGSWCFHYAPETYLEFVRSCCRVGTTLIIDVRKGKTEWSKTLERTFRLRAVLHLRPKFDRVVFQVDEHHLSRVFQGLVA